MSLLACMWTSTAVQMKIWSYFRSHYCRDSSGEVFFCFFLLLLLLLVLLLIKEWIWRYPVFSERIYWWDLLPLLSDGEWGSGWRRCRSNSEWVQFCYVLFFCSLYVTFLPTTAVTTSWEEHVFTKNSLFPHFCTQ